MSASERTPGPASKRSRASAQSALRCSTPAAVVTIAVEKPGVDARLGTQRERKVDIVEGVQFPLPQIETGEAVARDLRQRPDEDARHAARRGRGDRGGDARPLRRGVGGIEHEAGEIILVLGRIAQPRGGGRGAPGGRPGVAGEHEVVILELQPIEGRARPADRQVGAPQFGLAAASTVGR